MLCFEFSVASFIARNKNSRIVKKTRTYWNFMHLLNFSFLNSLGYCEICLCYGRGRKRIQFCLGRIIKLCKNITLCLEFLKKGNASKVLIMSVVN